MRPLPHRTVTGAWQGWGTMGATPPYPPASRGKRPRALHPRRPGERGQVLPLLALLFVVLTGFAALAIDAGVSYDQSRIDQDVADSAALSAAYWIDENQAAASVSPAATAAMDVAFRDCASPSEPCTLTLNFYSAYSPTTASGTVACSEAYVQPSTTPSTTCSTAPTSVTDVGAEVSNTASDYFANLSGGPRTHKVEPPEAVAAVQSAGAGDEGGVTLPCEICILGRLSIGAPNSGLYSSNGAIYVAGQASLTKPDDCVYASTSGSCGSTSGTAFDVYLDGGVSMTGSNDAIYPYTPSSKYHTSGAATVPSVSPPESGPNWGGLVDQGASYTPTCSSGTATVPSGRYENLYLSQANCTYVFSGNYIVTGTVLVDANHVTLQGSDVNVYFLCGTDSSPSTCSSGNTGGWLDDTGNHFALDLSAYTTGTSSGNVLFYFDPNDAGGVDANLSCTVCGIDISATQLSGTSTGALLMPGASLFLGSAQGGVFLSPLVVDNFIIESNSPGAGTGTLGGSTTVDAIVTPGGLVH